MKCRFSLMAAMAVLPLPMQLSRITPPHIRICSDKKPKQFNWLLSWVEFALVALKELHGLRVTQATFIVSCDTL